MYHTVSFMKSPTHEEKHQVLIIKYQFIVYGTLKVKFDKLQKLASLNLNTQTTCCIGLQKRQEHSYFDSLFFSLEEKLTFKKYSNM